MAIITLVIAHSLSRRNTFFAAVTTIMIQFVAKLGAVAIQRVQFNYQHCEPIKLFMRHGMLEQLTEIAYQLLRVFSSATYNLMMFVLVFPTNKKVELHQTGCSAFSFLILVRMVIGE